MKCSFLAVVLVLTVASVGCTSNADTTTTATTTTSPSAALISESVSGIVPVGGSDIHTFAVSQTGQLNVTLTAAAPPATIYMGLGIGTPSGSTCVFLSGGTTSVQAGTSPQLSGSSVAAGTYCVSVYDIGNQASPVTYSVALTHY